MLYNVYIKDEAYYEGIAADSEEQAILIATDWFNERKPTVKVTKEG